MEECEERGLGSGGAFDAAETECLQAVFEFFEVEQEVPAPEGGAFADGGGLCWLEVSESEAREAAILSSEAAELVDDLDEPPAKQQEAFSHEDQFRIIGDIATGGAEVNDWSGCRNDVAPCIDVRHHIVPQSAFVSVGCFEVDLVDGLPHHFQLFAGDCESEFLLAFGEYEPEFSPGGMAVLGGPDASHITGGVAGDQRVFVEFVGHGNILGIADDHRPVRASGRSVFGVGAVVSGLSRAETHRQKIPVRVLLLAVLSFPFGLEQYGALPVLVDHFAGG